MFDLKEKIALVTGAQRGMGKAHAVTLAAQGAKVVVTDVDIDVCQLVVDEITKNGGEALALKLNVSSKQEVENIIAQTVKQFGRLDILVNNAGVYSPVPALKLSEEEWDRTININLKGQFLCAQAAAKEMAKNHWGRIINISSVASGQVGVGLMDGAHYSASKGGVIAMSQSMAIEWASLGITVNVVAPGSIDTPMSRKARMPKEAMDEFLKQTVPLNRIGRPEEVSAAVVFLASEEASYITGSTIYVDGGWLAG